MVVTLSEKNVIFNAARDGVLRTLENCLGNIPREQVAQLVAARVNGATPLVMACRNGHLDVAKYLVLNCKANLEQTGSVTFDGETIEGAPPLWCAAAAGHFEIVTLLVGHGANVNSTTKTNSTPLRAACFDGHFHIVRYLISKGADLEIANRHGHSCLMIACYKGHYEIAKYLISLRADVNRKSIKGNTALHDCAESGSLEIMKLLLSHNARMEVDCYGMTPILAAAVTGHNHIVEYLLRNIDISIQEQIDALELLGATYLDKKRDLYTAAEMWSKALRLRGKHDLPKQPRNSPIAAFEGAEEVRTEEELVDCMTNPDAMRMQALLVRERILGPAHPDTSYFIRYRGAVYADAGDIPRCIMLWTYALDMQQAMLEPLSLMTQSSLMSFAELFACILTREIPADAPDTVPALLSIIERALKELKAGVEHIKSGNYESERDPIYLHRTLVITLHLACLLARCQPDKHTRESMFNLMRTLYRLVKVSLRWQGFPLNVRGRNGATALHLSVCSETTIHSRHAPFPAVDLAKLLLAVGADPTAADNMGNSPLHTAALNRHYNPQIFRILISGGAHYDQRNKRGKTFTDLLLTSHTNTSYWHRESSKNMSLKCMAATVVKREGLHRVDPLIPEELRQFVDIH
ncbi:unnamed protein product [Cyprideis torosa]|uniref:Uncharacterized protein n=1 Tax=Cyprideis torosa TaxID=163714 RepID=A0A7R8WFK2_9CRUS|nr:unnamed protein product [Cyprideis torosa]CAG0890707.1 unnamed protein product [Cyprideis torosa]